jgi:hypothetical protein
MKKIIDRQEAGRNTPAQHPPVQQDTAATPSPVLGGRRSLRQIPGVEKLNEELPIRQTTEHDDDLVGSFEQQPAHCREIIRKRVCGLLKRLTENAQAASTADLCHRGLSDQQYALLRSIASEVGDGNDNLLARLWSVDYAEVPPTISHFIHDDRFLGASFQSEDGKQGVYPEWETSLNRDFDLDSEVHNLVLTGALGIGKTTVLVIVILYRLCLATMLRDPQRFFGAGRISRLTFVLLSITKAAVRETAFWDALTCMQHSGYFVEQCGIDPNREYADGRIEMKRRLPDGRPCKILLTSGSRRQDVFGRHVLAAGLDEGNYRLEKDPDNSAYDLYTSLRARMANRFQQTPGYQPTLSIVASSAANEWSFTEKVIKEIEGAPDPTGHRIYRYAIYAIKRHLLDLDGVFFRVAYGIPNCDPVILKGYCDVRGQPVNDDPLEHCPQDASIELVPRMYEEHYLRNCRSALQDFSGISAGGTSRAFPEMCHFRKCIELGEQDGLREPTRSGVTTIPVTMEDDRPISHYLVPERFVTRQLSSPLPIRHPNSKRYVHIDLATRTTAGIAVCHLVGGSPQGQGSNYQLIVEYDFLLALGPGRNPPIYLPKIADFLFWLRNECGFRFGRITADSFQSEMLLQTLQGQGLETGHLSVDRDKSVYEAWRNGIEGHQIRLYMQDLLLKEAEFLQELERKFDHPVGGSKDLADAAAGAYFNAITSAEKTTLLAQNVPAVFGVGLVSVGHGAELTDFGIFEDYMRRNPRRIRQFSC